MRGTNGSGKSTVVRGIMTKGSSCTPIFAALGPRKPEAYHVRFSWGSVYVIGPYLTNTGGCDNVQPYSLILELVEKYRLKGHVVFEGSLISDNFGAVGEYLEKHWKDALVVFMSTPLDVCLKRLRVRTVGAGEKNVAKRYEAIERVYKKFVDSTIEVLRVTSETGTRDVLDYLSEG